MRRLGRTSLPLLLAACAAAPSEPPRPSPPPPARDGYVQVWLAFEPPLAAPGTLTLLHESGFMCQVTTGTSGVALHVPRGPASLRLVIGDVVFERPIVFRDPGEVVVSLRDPDHNQAAGACATARLPDGEGVVSEGGAHEYTDPWIRC